MPAQRLLMLSLLLSLSPGVKAQTDPLVQVLQHRHCPQCRLSDADLVHAQLNDANLRGAQLQRANLSQARLDGADLSNSNLSYTNLRGASLRGADLRGSRLYGTDLRDADLNGAQLDPQALVQTHWSGAQGISQGRQRQRTWVGACRLSMLTKLTRWTLDLRALTPWICSARANHCPPLR